MKSFLMALVCTFALPAYAQVEDDPGNPILPLPGEFETEVDQPHHDLAPGSWTLMLGARQMILDAFNDPFVLAAGFDTLLIDEAIPLYDLGISLQDQGEAAFAAGDTTTAHLKYLAAQLAFAQAYQIAQEIRETAWYLLGGGY